MCSKGKRKNYKRTKCKKNKKYSDEICSEETYMKYFRKYFNVEDKMFDEVTQLLLDTINGEFSRDNEKKEN